MATAALANVPTTISLAESTTGWTGDTFSLEPDIKVQGSNSIACTISTNGTGDDLYYTGFTAADLSAVHLRMWFNISFVGNLATTSPVQVFISDGTNTAYWDYPGGTTYAGGWAQAVIYTGNTPTSGTKPTGNSTRVGMRFNTASKPRNVPANTWFDAWYYGDGYTITGDTGVDTGYISWKDAAALDLVQAYGICSLVDGAFFAAGAIQIGDGTLATDFQDTGQILIFKDLPVNSTLYDITIFDDASAVTDVTISGGTYAAAGTQGPTYDSSISDINTMDMTGKQIAEFGNIDFETGQNISGVVFDGCDQIDPNGALMDVCVIKNTSETTTGSLIINSQTEAENCSNMSFQTFGNSYAVYVAAAVTSFSMSNWQFDDPDGTTDIALHWLGTSGTLTISKAAGTNLTSAGCTAESGGTVTVVSAVTIDVHVQDEDAVDVASAYVYIDTNPTIGDTADIANKITDVNGDITQSSYSGAATTATMRVRKYGYKQNKSQISLAGNTTNTVILIADPQQT